MMAAFFALVGGLIGLQFFYLGSVGVGIWILMMTFWFKWAKISLFIGFVHFLQLIFMSEDEFNKKYNKAKWREDNNRDNDKTTKSRHRREQSASQPPPQYTPAPRPTTATPQQSRQNNDVLKDSGIKKYQDFDIKNAIEDFGKALAIDPRDVSVHWNLACCYSLDEQAYKSFYHLEKAVAFGFRDYDKIAKHDALAFLRVQPEFSEFIRNGCQMKQPTEGGNNSPDLLAELQRLKDERAKGILTEMQYVLSAQKLFR